MSAGADAGARVTAQSVDADELELSEEVDGAPESPDAGVDAGDEADDVPAELEIVFEEPLRESVL